MATLSEVVPNVCYVDSQPGPAQGPYHKKYLPFTKKASLKGPKFYKKYEFFSNCCALFIISDVMDITNFTIDLQTDMLPITKKYIKYSLITLLKFINH